jgi:hypothetical protein
VLTSDADGGNDGFVAVGGGIVRAIHGDDWFEEKDASNLPRAQVLLRNAMRTKWHFARRGPEAKSNLADTCVPQVQLGARAKYVLRVPCR